MRISRRHFLRMGLPAAAALSACGTKRSFFSSSEEVKAFPLQRIYRASSKSFSGDNFTRPHAALWNKKSFLAAQGAPLSREEVPLVIVGGGISGMSAAFWLRDFRPVLLEQAAQFGGNSKGEVWEDCSYSIGAAYFVPSEEGSTSSRLLNDLNLADKFRVHADDAGAVFGPDGVVTGFWNGATDPARKNEFVRFRKHFEKLNSGPYPEIPYTSDGLSRSKMDELDAQSFSKYLKHHLGVLHPHLEEFVREYCWSSFGGGPEELSAAQGLNFLTSDIFETRSFPGGNSAISQALYDRLLAVLGKKRLRANSLTLDIRQSAQSVDILYLDEHNQLRMIRARACLVCVPKFIAKHLIDDLPTHQRRAMEKIKYRSYIVANLLLKGTETSSEYDLYRIDNENLKKRPDEREFTDLVFADWANQNSARHSVLTLYKPFPFDGGRALLFAPDSFAQQKKQFENALPEIFKDLKISQSRFVDLRLTRWGHPLCVASPGFLKDGVVKAAAKMHGRIAFAQQDNWANPCFETAIGSAEDAVSKIRKFL